MFVLGPRIFNTLFLLYSPAPRPASPKLRRPTAPSPSLAQFLYLELLVYKLRRFFAAVILYYGLYALISQRTYAIKPLMHVSPIIFRARRHPLNVSHQYSLAARRRQTLAYQSIIHRRPLDVSYQNRGRTILQRLSSKRINR